MLVTVVSLRAGLRTWQLCLFPWMWLRTWHCSGDSSARSHGHSLDLGCFVKAMFIIVCHGCTAQIGLCFKLWGVNTGCHSFCHPLSPLTPVTAALLILPGPASLMPSEPKCYTGEQVTPGNQWWKNFLTRVTWHLNFYFNLGTFVVAPRETLRQWDIAPSSPSVSSHHCTEIIHLSM